MITYIIPEKNSKPAPVFFLFFNGWFDLPTNGGSFSFAEFAPLFVEFAPLFVEFAPLFVEFAPLSKNARAARKPLHFRRFPTANDTKA